MSADQERRGEVRAAIVAGLAGGLVVAAMPRLLAAVGDALDQVEDDRREAIVRGVARTIRQCDAERKPEREP